MNVSDCVVCNVCSKPQHIDDSAEIAKISSNVRKFAGEQFTVWRCANCKSLHSKEMIDLRRYYEDYVYQSHRLDFFTSCGYRNRLRSLRKHGVDQNTRILDYGCGAGLFVNFLRQRGYHAVEGYDEFDPQFLDKNVLEGEYDAVVSFDVIEHVEQPREFISNISALTCPNGLVAIGTPNASRLLLSNPAACELHQPFHRHILSEESLLDLSSRAGLEVIELQRRHYLDTRIPGVNLRCAWEYVAGTGGLVDVLVEPLQLKWLFSGLRMRLVFFALFGYYFPPRGNMLAFFKKGA